MDAHHSCAATRQFLLDFRELRFALATFGLVAASAGSAPSWAAWALFGTTLGARLVLHFSHRIRDDRGRLSDLWLVPLRDALVAWVWCRSFFTSHVTWRGTEFAVGADGVMRPLS